MRSVRFLLLGLGVLLAPRPVVAQTSGQVGPESGWAGASPPPAVPGRVVVKLREDRGDGAANRTAEEFRARLGAAAARGLLSNPRRWSERLAVARSRRPARSRRAPASASLPDMSAVYVLTVPSGRDTDEFCRQARRDPQIEYCHPDAIVKLDFVPNDPLFSSSGSWGQSFADLWALHLIGAEAAWDVSTGAGVRVAVVDSGITPTAELRRGVQLWRNEVERHGARGVDDDGNGFVDDIAGWNFVTCEVVDSVQGSCAKGKPGPNVRDRYGHGTAVSGVIAAAGNDRRGIIGLSFGAQLMAVRAFNTQGVGASSEVAAAVLYAAENGADIINMSWGSPGWPASLQPQVVTDAIAVARGLGVVLVAAAGNDGQQRDPRMAPIPAGLPGVIPVSAFNPSDQRASFSTHGSWISLAAPGAGPEDTDPPSGTRPLDAILSIGAPRSVLKKLFRRDQPDHVVDHRYIRVAGTSLAAPHVAAAAALVLSGHPEFTAEQVEQVLRETAVDVAAPGRDVEAGYGRLDVASAVSIDSMPVARLTLPAYDARVREPTAVSGTAARPGGQVASWRLLLGPEGGPLAPLAEGTTAVRDDTLATLDPATLILQQPYTLRLEVTDTSGGSATDTVRFTPFPPPPVPPITFHKVFEISAPELSSGHAIVDDLDRDGRPEIIYCTCESPSASPVVHIWENTGDNQYSEVFSTLLPTELGPYNCPWRLVVGDIDGDGTKELLVVRVGGVVNVLANVGDNAYVPRPEVDAQLNAGRPGAAGPVTAFVADMNGDGQPDIGFVDSPTTPTPGNTNGNLFLYQHTGPPGQQTYETALSMYFEVLPLFLTELSWSAIGDSDNDGFPEVVVGTLIGGAPIQRIQWNPSLGAYEWTHTVPDYPARGGLPFVADVDGDGKNELLYATATGSGIPVLLIYKSTGDDTYQLAFRETESLYRGLSLTATTLPGTSLPLIVVPGFQADSDPGRLLVFAPTSLPGDYANLTPEPIVIPNKVFGVAAGDFDGDGKLDVMIANNGTGGYAPAVAIYEQE